MGKPRTSGGDITGDQSGILTHNFSNPAMVLFHFSLVLFPQSLTYSPFFDLMIIHLGIFISYSGIGPQKIEPIGGGKGGERLIVTIWIILRNYLVFKVVEHNALHNFAKHYLQKKLVA